MDSSTGTVVYEDEIINSYKSSLFPLLELFTPNKSESQLFTGMNIEKENDIIEAGIKLTEMGCKAVLMKGGHYQGVDSVDYLITNKQEIIKYSSARINSKNDHGTGCTSTLTMQLTESSPTTAVITDRKSVVQGKMVQVMIASVVVGVG